MVEVNGSMVPPLGQGQQGERSITIDKVKDSKGKSVTLTIPDKWKKSDDGPKNDKLGDKKRSPKGFPGGYVSVDPEPPPPDDKDKKPCKATIYLHLTLAGKGCSAVDVNTAMQLMEAGAKKLGGTCVCPHPPAGEEHDKNEGRTVEVVIVWHPKAGGGVATVTLVCGPKPPTHGEASSESATIKFNGNLGLPTGPNVGALESLCAHEMGHLLFGTGSHSLGKEDVAEGDDPWSQPQGHNPDPNGLMRNTEKDPNNPDRKKNSRLKEDDKVTQKEVCILCNKAGLKEADCCTYKKKSAAIVLPTRSTIVSSVSQIAGDYVT